MTVHPKVMIESVGASLPAWWKLRKGSLSHSVEAGRRCLAASRIRKCDVGVLVNAGVYRDGHVAEPAIAAYIQHKLGINVEFQGHPTLSFDLVNGGCGMLNAAQVVCSMLQSGQAEAGMVVAGEANSDRDPEMASRVARSGAALMLTLAPGKVNGFGAFAFQTHEEDADLIGSVVSLAVPRGRLTINRQSRLEDAWLGHACGAVDEVLAAEGLVRDQVDFVVPAQISPGFLSRLPTAIGFPAEKVVDFTATLPDTGSTSVFVSWHRFCLERKPVSGKRALFLAFGSGLTVGAAIYTV